MVISSIRWNYVCKPRTYVNKRHSLQWKPHATNYPHFYSNTHLSSAFEVFNWATWTTNAILTSPTNSLKYTRHKVFKRKFSLLWIFFFLLRKLVQSFHAVFFCRIFDVKEVQINIFFLANPFPPQYK